MRQNKRSIQVHSLLKEKKIKPTTFRQGETKIVCIPGDKKHTQFEVAWDRDEQEIIEKYKNKYK